jgi:hypothetical protein
MIKPAVWWEISWWCFWLEIEKRKKKTTKTTRVVGMLPRKFFFSRTVWSIGLWLKSMACEFNCLLQETAIIYHVEIELSKVCVPLEFRINGAWKTEVRPLCTIENAWFLETCLPKSSHMSLVRKPYVSPYFTWESQVKFSCRVGIGFGWG